MPARSLRRRSPATASPARPAPKVRRGRKVRPATSRILLSAEGAGINCANGGERIDIGIDSNNDGVLNVPGEVQQTAYICNGTGSCGMGMSTCGGGCANLATDDANCGACGNVCGAGTACKAGVCTPVICSASQAKCNGFCTDVGSDPMNCGACGNVCGPGQACGGGTCVDVDFGNVPINTTVSRTVTISVDAGYRAQLASGTGINAPFGFNFDTCGAGGGFTGPGTCTVVQQLTPTAAGVVSGTTNVFECPVAGGSCIALPYTVRGNGVVTATAIPNDIDFGNVPLNTTVMRSVTIVVDAGYRTQLASGTGINVPFGFDFGTCGAGGGFTGPGTCTINEHFTPTAITPSFGMTNVFQCPVVGGSCLPIPLTVHGNGISVASVNPGAVDFGPVPIGTKVSRNLTVRVDAGYRTQLASGTGINLPFSFDFDTCGAGGGFSGPGLCSVIQSFTPTAAVMSAGLTNVFECPIVGGSCLPIPYNVAGSGF